MIAVLSDTHDAKNNLAAALEEVRRRDVAEVVFCGDLKSPGMVARFEGFEPFFVLGNADRETAALTAEVQRLYGDGRVGEVLALERGGSRIAVVHGHTRALRRLIEAGEHEYIFCGHTHRRRDEQIGATRVINPGALGGIKRESRSFALVDPAAGTVEFIEMG